MTKAFDVVVIGAGPGGYIAAVRAAQLGFSVACVEKWQNPKGDLALGGTCLNVGCIPSKALLASSEEYEKVGHHLAEHGIEVSGARLDLAKMLGRKEAIVSRMTKGVEFLFRKNKITWLKGHGKFTGKSGDRIELQVLRAAGDKSGTPTAGSGGGEGGGSGEGGATGGSADAESDAISARHVIIATGSKARHLPFAPVDNVLIADNEGGLSFDTVPAKLTVIGAGVIGLELGSVWRRLGADVTVLEALPQFLGACDQAVAKEALKIFTRQGLKIQMGVKISEVKTSGGADGGPGRVVVQYADAEGQPQTIESDRLIVSVGRVPNTDDLGLEAIGIELDRGVIPVDEHCATRVPNVWAIGDVVRGPMLAHKAEDEGVMVAEAIAGQKPHIDYNCIPWVIYTAPEIAWVGQTEQQLKEAGRAVRTGQFPFIANGRALGMAEADGFVKFIADEATDEILGVHIIGSGASDLIAEAVVAMEFKAAAEDIGRICHPHPSLSEVMREAALAVDKRALNM
jgi:dihydrolipoamide dehydrogenase